MIVDSSALLAILIGEPEREQFIELIAHAEDVAIAAPTVLEATIALSRLDAGMARDLERFIAEADIAVVPFGAEHLAFANEAHRRFGRNSGSPARLNYGDCISYAVAKCANEPLLFKGNDFSQTDIRPAL
ncbi:MAG: type II toxin-antitoxin system VapC family toxin [Vulcanimicrobiaceae bacterium]